MENRPTIASRVPLRNVFQICMLVLGVMTASTCTSYTYNGRDFPTKQAMEAYKAAQAELQVADKQDYCDAILRGLGIAKASIYIRIDQDFPCSIPSSGFPSLKTAHTNSREFPDVESGYARDPFKDEFEFEAAKPALKHRRSQNYALVSSGDYLRLGEYDFARKCYPLAHHGDRLSLSGRLDEELNLSYFRISDPAITPVPCIAVPQDKAPAWKHSVPKALFLFQFQVQEEVIRKETVKFLRLTFLRYIVVTQSGEVFSSFPLTADNQPGPEKTGPVLQASECKFTEGFVESVVATECLPPGVRYARQWVQTSGENWASLWETDDKSKQWVLTAKQIGRDSKGQNMIRILQRLPLQMARSELRLYVPNNEDGSRCKSGTDQSIVAVLTPKDRAASGTVQTVAPAITVQAWKMASDGLLSETSTDNVRCYVLPPQAICLVQPNLCRIPE